MLVLTRTYSCMWYHTHTFLHSVLVLVVAGTNTTSMAHPIHQETFYFVESIIKDDVLDAYLNSIQASPPTIILAKDMCRVHHVTRLLWDCNLHATYYHKGHTQDQLVSQQTPILVLSLQTDSIKHFVGSPQRVLVLDFPGSINHYQDWKSLVNLQDKYGHITSFISDQIYTS